MPARSETLQLIIRAKGAPETNRAIAGIRKTITALPGAIFNLKTAIAGAGVGILGKQFVDAASTAEQYRVRLNRLLGSVQEGTRLFKAMSDYAGSVSFQYEEIMGAATSLSGVMKGGVDEIRQWMPLIGDLAAASGLTIEETTSQVIRMYSAGAASADMFRERGILAMLGFQAGVSYSAEETRKKLMEAWQDPASQFKGAAGDLGKTWDGLLSMISDLWFQFRNMVMESGVFDYMKALVMTFLDFTKRLKAEGKLDVYANEMAKNIIKALDYVIKSFAAVLETLTLLKRGFEGIKIILNSLLAGWAQKWANILKLISRAAEFFGFEKIASGLNRVSDEFSAVSEVARSEVDKSITKLEGLAKKQGTYWKAVGTFIDATKKKAQELAQVEEKTVPKVKGPTVDAKTVEARQKAFVAYLKEKTKTALLELENAYKNGTIQLEKYFNERKALITKEYDAEIALAQKAAEAEADPTKREELNTKVLALREDLNRELLKLDQDRIEKQKALEEQELTRRKILEDLKYRAVADSATNMQAGFDREMGELDRRHQEEIQRLQELNASKAELDEAYRSQKMEKDKLMFDQERRLHEARMQMARDVAGGMKDIFNDLYEMSGKKTKEWFYLAKAAAIAEATINTSQAITKALAQGGYWGIAMATIVGLKGALEIAKISTQKMAAGGLIGGSSPNDRADDKLIAATSGEFIHPVDTVRHYGARAMEAIRQKLVPREWFSNINMPSMRSPRYAFATGGSVTASAGISSGKPVVIANFYDRQEMARFLATVQGQDAIVNVLAAKRNIVRKVLA